MRKMRKVYLIVQFSLIGFIICHYLTRFNPVHAEPEVVPNHIIVRFYDGLDESFLQQKMNEIDIALVKPLVPSMNIWLTEIDFQETDLETALDRIRDQSEVRYAQKDHILTLRQDQLFPNDPEFGQQWNFHNTGQSGGVADADIDGPEAWYLTTNGENIFGEELVIAIIDNGFQINHVDLADNIWVNPNEIPGDGIDNDENDYIDDVSGWDVYGNDGTHPIQSHGTHVTGIAAAVGDNQTGIASVTWNAKILPISGESSATSIVAASYNYVITMKTLYLETEGEYGANVVVTNNSFGVNQADCNTGDYPIWNDLYNEMGSLGILSAGATANANWNIDVVGDVPTGCDSPYMVSVTGTNRSDGRSGFGYGAETIDLGAPGSSVRGTRPSNSYGTGSGTSYACPHVAGAVSFLHAVGSETLIQYYYDQPDSASLLIKEMILSTVDSLPAMQGNTPTVSGGRLNLYQAALLAMNFGISEDTLIVVSIDTVIAEVGQNVLVPINVSFPQDSLFSSLEMRISGYHDYLIFEEFVTDGSMLGLAGWVYEINETDSVLIIAASGSNDISGQGVLFRLNFFVPETTLGFVPVTLDWVLFDDGSISVVSNSGGVYVFPATFYGDVDLNGLVQAYDASFVLKYLVDQIELNEQQLRNANVTADATVSALDASIILQYVVELIDELPYDTTEVFIAQGDIYMENAQVYIGQEIEIPLYLTNGDNIFAFEAMLVYEPDILTYIDTVWSDQLNGFFKEAGIEAGSIKLAGAGTLPDGQEDTFVTIRFMVTENFSEPGTVVSLERLRWNENTVMENVAQATLSQLVGIEDNEVRVKSIVLHQNYPNPFNPLTTISFSLPNSQFITLKVFDLSGRLVKSLIDEQKNAGRHDLKFDASSLSSGLYFYELMARNTVNDTVTYFKSKRKMLFLK